MTTHNDLINVITSRNPFDRSLVVRSHDIWVTGFPDVPSINAHASDAIFDAIEKVRKKQQSVIGITIKAERGLGKSHLISRIRSKIQTEHSTLFVYVNDIGDLNKIKSEFLRNLSNSLKQCVSEQVSQWRELATALFNEAYNKEFSPEELIKHFSEVREINPQLVEHWTGRILGIKSDIENPDIIAAILWTLSPNPLEEINAIKWLSGQELAQSKADALGIANPSIQDRETQAFSTIRQILDLISDYKPIVICFDEVENGRDKCSDAGYTSSQVIALLGKELYDKIKRGVLVTAMFPQTWNDEVRALNQAESVTDRIAQKIIELTYLKPDDVINLVSQWLTDFYNHQGITPPHPVYPFEEEKLRALGKERPIVRKVLQWCKENWIVPQTTNSEDTPVITSTTKKDPVESAYNKELEALQDTLQNYMENKAILADALRLGCIAVTNKTVDNVQVESVEDIQTKAADKGYLDFKIVGKENGKTVKIGVAVLQESGGMFVQATLKRLIRYKDFDITRGCLVRSKQIGRNAAKAQQYLSQLLSPQLGGEWVLLKSEDIKPLLAIFFVLKAREDYEVTEDDIIKFCDEKRIAIDNYLIREILSDPSGQIPNDATEE